MWLTVTKNFREESGCVYDGSKEKLLSQLWWASLLRAEKECISGYGASSHMYHVRLQVIKIFGPLKSTFLLSQKQQWISKIIF